MKICKSIFRSPKTERENAILSAKKKHKKIKKRTKDGRWKMWDALASLDEENWRVFMLSLINYTDIIITCSFLDKRGMQHLNWFCFLFLIVFLDLGVGNVHLKCKFIIITEYATKIRSKLYQIKLEFWCWISWVIVSSAPL